MTAVAAEVAASGTAGTAYAADNAAIPAPLGRHSYLGGVSPDEFEAAHRQRRQYQLNRANSTFGLKFP
jgi:hypothetical protein